MDANGDALTVGLLTDDALDMDGPLETVDAGDFALTALVRATDNRDLVVLADRESADLLGLNISIPLLYRESSNSTTSVTPDPFFVSGHKYTYCQVKNDRDRMRHG